MAAGYLREYLVVRPKALDCTLLLVVGGVLRTQDYWHPGLVLKSPAVTISAPVDYYG